MNYVSLHIHTDGSVFDGACGITRLVSRAKELGMTALGITDHGNMIKTYEFQEECIKQGIKPIIGCEFYVGEPGTSNTYHLICIAKNDEGLKNLFRLNAYAYTKNFYNKPRITYEQLQLHKEGLIVTTACLGSEVGQRYLEGNEVASMTVIERLKGIVDDLYLEIQANSIPAQREYNKFIVTCSEECCLPLIATNDVHYVYREDFKAHDAILCMQTKKKIDDEKRFRFSGNDYYLKYEGQVINELRSLGIEVECIKEAIINTKQIADMCTAQIKPSNFMPHFCDDEDSVLAKNCAEGWKTRYNSGDIDGTQEEYERVQYELNIIRQKGYSGYYLIVEDFVKFAKDNGILVGDGRGSGAGSMVAYLLNITNLHPMKHGLLFERFLNPDRNSPPDFDIDFDYNRRVEVINYIKEKYGEDRVAHIIAEGTMACKAVVRRVMSVYDYEQRFINQVCSSIPDLLGITLEQAHAMSNDFRNYMNDMPAQYEIMKTLEGLMSHVSKHAAGIVICNQPIINVCPCMTSDDDGIEVLMTQWHKKILERLGFFKFDFLALKTLTLIDETIRRVRENRGIEIKLKDIDMNDRVIYNVINSPDLSGIFQFSEPAGQQTVELVKPNNFNDIIACEALCRPGVKERELYIQNKNNTEHVSLANTNDIIIDILAETYGAIVYQEQTMLLMNRLTGNRWTLGKADSMRKVKNLEDYRLDFVNCCVENGVDADLANRIYDRFSLEYSFNKSHAGCYAKTTGYTAWLKGNYREEFMASLATIDNGNSDVIPGYIKECRRYGINVLPPDINKSTELYENIDGYILMPLNSIKGAGDASINVILNVRASGKFKSFEDFLTRTKNRAVNKKVIIQLIKAGCFDKFEMNRNILIGKYLTLRGEQQQFMTWCDELCMYYEMETLSMSLTKNKLDGIHVPQFSNQPDGDCWTGGLISKISAIKDRNNNDMAFVTIENKTDIIECIVFSYYYKKCSRLLVQGGLVKVRGVKEGNKLKVNEMEVL